VKEIEVEAFLKPMSDGITKPALVIGDDQAEYVLKNQKIFDGTNYINLNCMFLNEALAYKIGIYLGVPMPEVVIGKIPQELFAADPSIRFTYKFEPGIFFATKALKNVENNVLENYNNLRKMKKPYILRPWNTFFKEIKNKNDVAKIIAMDILIANFDRYINTGNILIDNENGRKVYAIDHGHSFWGPIWNDSKRNCLGIEKVTDEYKYTFASNIINIMRKAGACDSGIVFASLEQHIHLEDLNNHSFKNVVLKIRNINNDMIRNWCKEIPDEWYINREVQTNYYENFIINQKEAVGPIIQILADNNAFRNYRGGILEYGEFKEENLI